MKTAKREGDLEPIPAWLRDGVHPAQVASQSQGGE